MRYRPSLTAILPLLLIAATAPGQGKSAAPMDGLPAGFREVSTTRYLIYTDIAADQLRGVELRLDRLAAEYDKRTREFGQVRSDKQLPLYLFSKQEDYHAAGGRRGSAGVFEGDRMMACVGEKTDSRAWSTIQHEAFHQYAATKLGHLPIWVNEGLSEYFGHGIFTGDGFVCGVIPHWRLQRVRAHLAANEFLRLEDMLRYTHEEWNQRIESVNYDQAWAYIQFLAHGSGAKVRDGLVKYIREVGRGQDPVNAFRANLDDPEIIQKRFAQWVAALPDNPTLALYGEAGVATVTSFVARAAACRQAIRSMDELTALVERRELKCLDEDWIPVQILQELLPLAGQLGSWSITPGSRKEPPAIVLRQEYGTVIRGMFTLNRDRVARVWVETQQSPQASPLQKPGAP